MTLLASYPTYSASANLAFVPFKEPHQAQYVHKSLSVTGGGFGDWPLPDFGTSTWGTVVEVPKWRDPMAGYRPTFLSAYAATSDRYVSSEASSAVIDNALERLEEAAMHENERAFVTACRAIDWQARSVEDHIRAINLAFLAGAHMAARELAVHGAELFSNDPEIQRYARVLAPPVVSKSTLAADPSIGANRDWLSTHGDTYRGLWIGLRNGQFLGSSASIVELIGQIGDTNGALLTRVL